MTDPFHLSREDNGNNTLCNLPSFSVHCQDALTIGYVVVDGSFSYVYDVKIIHTLQWKHWKFCPKCVENLTDLEVISSVDL